jgi:hypothetical protein
MADLNLEVGRTYFRLTFADPDMTIPGVEPMVYLGDADPVDGERPHIFQDTVSYSRFGSRLDHREDRDEISVYFITPNEIGSCVVDTQSMAEEMRKAAERAKTFDYPKLRVLRTGWRDEKN